MTEPKKLFQRNQSVSRWRWPWIGRSPSIASHDQEATGVLLVKQHHTLFEDGEGITEFQTSVCAGRVKRKHA